MKLIELQKTNPTLTQVLFAQLATFGFNKSLISLACQHFNDSQFEQQLLAIVDHKSLLSQEKESILKFFDRVEVSRQSDHYQGESVRLCVKSGKHLIHASRLISNTKEFVSTNEHDYCLRRGTWFIDCVNKLFSPIINQDFNLNLLVMSRKFDQSCLQRLKDVKKFDGKTLITTSGETFKCLTISE